ncbi:valine--tRNA ligase [Thermodesulfobium sp. 4217-1]|uniref:valine--tRNA ligase n=1 Tax=Thermodesulfobium sp. 4217-1 TaxID=3120013 RepID=UPI00322188EE
MDKIYQHNNTEKEILNFWLDNHIYHANERSSKDAFSIVIPPPNVTGSLHLGHALDDTLQDIICRYKRLLGFEVLWLPGTDHAGIATQNVVEKMLHKEGKTRQTLGRDKFIERVWEWKEQYGQRIINQLKSLGASCDWDRERFTMDEGLSKAVKKAFVTLYNKGLIYKGTRIINWCPRCSTALADLEVEHEDREDKLYFVKYKFLDSPDKFITIATTRPETIFADTAVAVNPKDERFKGLVGGKVLVPMTDRVVEIISDSLVETDFGTGALKITPGHDPMDFEIGLAHNLEVLIAIDSDGKMTDLAGDLKGLDRDSARKKSVEILEEMGALEKIEDLKHAVGHCYRCKTVIEPYVSEQWFVKSAPLAKKAMEAVKNDIVQFSPERWEKIYFDWLENIKDWCISRQIWWGHRIPAWYCDDCNEIIVSENEPNSCPKCNSTNLRQDEDVLDTWFSSSLWPFSTMGWPEETEELKKFFPTSVLVTGFDIIYFWVARMIMMSLALTEKEPFKNVIIHGLIRDPQGRKMSKSIGNVIDPMDIIEESGADALRFSLASLSNPSGQDIKMSKEKVKGARNFANKLWNTARFVLNYEENVTNHNISNEDIANMEPEDIWILSRSNSVIDYLCQKLDEYNFSAASTEVYNFIWDEFCDWYIELTKFRIKNHFKDELALKVLFYTFRQSLILLHPFMPFITEYLYRRLPNNKESITFETLKKFDHPLSPEKIKHMTTLVEATKSTRKLRSEYRIAPDIITEPILVMPDDIKSNFMSEIEKYCFLTKSKTPQIIQDTPVDLKGYAIERDASITVLLYLEQDNLKKSKELIEKSLQKLLKEFKISEQRLSDPNFLKGAPEEVIESEKEKIVNQKESIEILERKLSFLK